MEDVVGAGEDRGDLFVLVGAHPQPGGIGPAGDDAAHEIGGFVGGPADVALQGLLGLGKILGRGFMQLAVHVGRRPVEDMIDVGVDRLVDQPQVRSALQGLNRGVADLDLQADPVVLIAEGHGAGDLESRGELAAHGQGGVVAVAGGQRGLVGGEQGDSRPFRLNAPGEEEGQLGGGVGGDQLHRFGIGGQLLAVFLKLEAFEAAAGLGENRGVAGGLNGDVPRRPALFLGLGGKGGGR